MKHITLAVMMLAVFAVSCTQAPITAPSVALNTATPHPETAIPIATDAPTAVHTPTKNSGSTLTATATRIPPTEPPTPTEPPRPMRVVFQRDFSDELDIVKAAADHWNYLHEDGTKVEIIPDPTDSSDLGGRLRGNVLKVTIHNDPVQHPDWAGGQQWWRAGYPDWTHGYPVKLVQAPSGIQVDVFKPSDLYGISLLSVHRQNKNNKNDRTSVAGFEIYNGASLVLVVRDGQGKDTRVKLKRGLFKSDQWNTLRLDFLVDGSVIPFVNGQNAYANDTDLLKVPVDTDYDAGFADGHAGLLSANQSKEDGFKEGQYLLNDNFMVFEYQQ